MGSPKPTSWTCWKRCTCSGLSTKGRAVITHEANVIGGVGGEIAAILADQAFTSLKAPIKRIGGEETPIPVSPSLESAVVPGEDDILDVVRALI